MLHLFETLAYPYAYITANMNGCMGLGSLSMTFEVRLLSTIYFKKGSTNLEKGSEGITFPTL